MWSSTFPGITRHNRPQASECANEWRANKIRGRSQNGPSDCFSAFPCTLAIGYEILERAHV